MNSPTVAEVMVDIFLEHRDAEGNIDLDGMNKLADIFENVSIHERGFVFEQFLDVLDERGIEYDVKKFRGEPN